MDNNFKRIDPAFKECSSCIVFCADEGYMALTSVAIESIAEKASLSEWYDILILHSGISETHPRIYQDHWKRIPNLSIRFVDVSCLFDGLKLFTENRKTISREAYFRIAIPWVLSDRYTKALYLDGDMIVLRDISEIFKTDLGDDYLAAVRDYWGICNCYIPGDHRRDYRIRIGLRDIDSYIISATLLFDLKQWRDRFDLEDVLSLCASKQWEQHDQDVINVLCRDRIRLLSPKWGMMEDYGNNYYLPEYLQNELQEGQKDLAVVHFGGNRKPYKKSYTDHDTEFWNYADHTPYMGELFSRITSPEYRSYVAIVTGKGPVPVISDDKGRRGMFRGVEIPEPYVGDRGISRIMIKNEALYLEGWIRYFEPSKGITAKPFLMVNGKKLEPSRQKVSEDGDHRLEIPRFECHFEFKVPLDKRKKRIQLGFTLGGDSCLLKDIRFMRYAPFSGRYKAEYYSENGWCIKSAEEMDAFIIQRSSPLSVLKNEAAFSRELLRSERLSDRKAVFVRWAAHLVRMFLRKPVWLVSDRLDKADDCGEAFFRYLKRTRTKEVHSYFLLSRTAPNYDRIKKLGGIVEPYSWRHKILALVAGWSISSQTDLVFRQPFRNYEQPYRNILAKKKFVFLQHGVITADLSRWLRKDVQQFDGFVTSTEEETRKILEGNYGYTKDQIWMTGLTRFDRLHNKPGKLITVMPTWRKQLVTWEDPLTGKWGVKPGFSESEYVVFYRNLMNDHALKAAADQYGYKIQIRLHPVFQHLSDMFRFGEGVKVVPAEKSYSEIYSMSSLLVTDYSSSIQDFIYLEKPVVYCQFDKDMFFNGEHIYDKGDMDSEKEGFGEVTYTLEELVSAVISYMKSGCEVREPYKTRIRKAFPDREQNHCEKLYQKIMEADAEDRQHYFRRRIS